MNRDMVEHYDALITEGNDPVSDPPELQAYMDKWDGDYFISLLELDKTKDILEIGCGTGRLSVRAAPQVHSFCGIDISPKTIEKAQTHLKGKHIHLICGDFLTHHFEAKYDLIFSSLTFMHIENKHEAIRKISDLLTKNGIFLLSIDKNRSSILDYGTRKVKIYPDDPDEIIGMMKNCCFIETTKYEVEFAYLIKARRK